MTVKRETYVCAVLHTRDTRIVSLAGIEAM